MSELVTISIRLPREFYERVKEVAQQRGIRVAALIKMLLNDWLREQEFYKNVPED